LKLLPKNKFDFAPFPALMEISEEKIQPILPQLLFWIADMNWPIATSMVKVLIRFPDSVVPLIRERLKPTETDEDWKFFIIVDLLPALPITSQELLVESIERILNTPTDEEVSCCVREAAKNYMNKRGRRVCQRNT